MSDTINTTNTWYENFSLAGEGEVIVHETCPTCNHTKTFTKVCNNSGGPSVPKTDEPTAKPKTDEPTAKPKTDEPTAKPKTDKPTAKPKTSEWSGMSCRRPIGFKPTKKKKTTKKE